MIKNKIFLKIKKTSFFLIFLLFHSCMVGPDPKVEKKFDTKEKFQEVRETDKDFELTKWWQQFNDPDLNMVVSDVIANNYDILIAIEKIEEARAIYGIKRADLLPQIELQGNAERRKFSENIFEAPVLRTGKHNFFEFGFDTNWEIDLFGKIRRAKQAALFEICASQFNEKNVYISIISEATKFYILTISYKSQIEKTKNIIELEETLLTLIKDKYESGLSSEIDINDILSDLNNTKALYQTLQTLYKKSYYSLCNLLGKSYNSLDENIFNNKTLPSIENKVPEVLPSELIERRFDIQEAKYQLFSAISEIGVAKADLFPRFSLTGRFFKQSDKTGNLLDSKSSAWSIGPRFFWPLIDFGKIRSNIKAKTSKQKQVLLNYENTIIGAFKEVEITLQNYFKEFSRYQNLETTYLAKKDSYELGISTYDSGLDSLFNLYNKKINALNAAIEYTKSHEKLLLNLVNLYKALGGEW